MFWTRINLSKYAEPEIEEAALAALHRNDVSHAVNLLEIATKRRDAPARAWYNLGVALEHQGKLTEAAVALQHAAQMPGADQQMLDAARHK